MDELATTGDALATQFNAAGAMSEEQSAIQTAVIIAHRFPRNDEQVMDELSAFLKRPRAADAALYRLERKNRSTGELGIIQNFTVRFAEEIALRMGNIMMTQKILADTPDSMTISVNCYDAQRNLRLSEPVYVSKTVERSRLWQGQSAIAERKNSRGQTTFIVHATDDEVRTKMQALIAKARRNLLLQLLSAEYKDELLEIALETKLSSAQADSQSAEGQAKLVDAFSKQGVSKADIEKYLGHPIAGLTPDELVALRGIHRAIASEGLTWASATGADQPDAPTRSSLNLDDIKPGNQADHTPVDQPINKPPECMSIWEGFVKSEKLNQKAQDEILTRLMAEMDAPHPSFLSDEQAPAFTEWLIAQKRGGKK